MNWIVAHAAFQRAGHARAPCCRAPAALRWKRKASRRRSGNTTSTTLTCAVRLGASRQFDAMVRVRHGGDRCRESRRADRRPCRRGPLHLLAKIAAEHVAKRAAESAGRAGERAARLEGAVERSAHHQGVGPKPMTASGPRAMVKLSSAACSINFDTGFCGVPLRFRGACASSASRIADMAMAAGASTVRGAGKRRRRQHPPQAAAALPGAKTARAGSSAASRR